MKLRMAALALAAATTLLAGCGDGSDPVISTPEPVNSVAPQPEDVNSAITLVDFSTGVIAVENTGKEAGIPADLELCQDVTCIAIPTASLEPSQIVTVQAADVGEIDSAGGELALYATEGDDRQMITYVAWGDSEHPNAATAVAANLWESESASVPDTVEFLSSRSAVPARVSDWIAG